MTLNNPLTFLSDQEIVSPLGINTISSRQWWEERKKSIRGLLVDPVPSSPNWHHKNCLADSKEYLWWDLGSQRIDSGPIHLFSIILREFLGIMYSSREYPNPCESNCKFQRVWEVKDTGKYWGPCMFPLYFDLCSSLFLYPSFGLCTSEVLGTSCFIKLWKNDVTLVGY